MAQKPIGKCALTGIAGTFVKSHLIPKAFSKRATIAPFVEFYEETHPRRFFDSWYDRKLVIRKGEDILAQLDQLAAETFRKKQLIYRDRRGAQLQLTPNFIDDNFIIEVFCKNFQILHRFAISLYWRTAATTTSFGSLVQVRDDIMTSLRNFTTGAASPLIDDFPVIFGVFDSQIEIAKIHPYIIHVNDVPFCRVFLDGIVCYISAEQRIESLDCFGKLILGKHSNILLMKLPSAPQGKRNEQFLVDNIQRWGNPWPNFFSP